MRGPHPFLTEAGLRALRLLAEAEDRGDHEAGEIACEGIQCWLGHARVHRRTVADLLRLAALSESTDGGALQRFRINGTGLAILRRPELSHEVVEALARGGAFTIRDDRVVPLDPGPGPSGRSPR